MLGAYALLSWPGLAIFTLGVLLRILRWEFCSVYFKLGVLLQWYHMHSGVDVGLRIALLYMCSCMAVDGVVVVIVD